MTLLLNTEIISLVFFIVHEKVDRQLWPQLPIGQSTQRILSIAGMAFAKLTLMHLLPYTLDLISKYELIQS